MRGQPLASATEVFRGSKSDGGYGVSPLDLHDGAGDTALLISRPLSTFEAASYIVTAQGPQRLGVPLEAQPPGSSTDGYSSSFRKSGSVDGSTFPQGSLVAVDLAAATADPRSSNRRSSMRPDRARRSTESQRRARGCCSSPTKTFAVASWVYTPASGRRMVERAARLARRLFDRVNDADQHGETAYSTTTSFLVPPTLWQLDAATARSRSLKTSPARFDASNDVVEQREATSKDGTRIPYFIVHPKNMKLDGNNPTLLYAYGGFDVSETPNYNGILGKLWLERGGVYVLANIRGGGEFGPAWHDAGLTTHRQRIYDDFAAVARRISSPRRSPARVASASRAARTAGLLMGVEFTQHPELWHAVDIQVPLLDMLRYEQIEAGASWTGEYGSVSDPAQRAFLASISPYNNLKAGVAYPGAADLDDDQRRSRRAAARAQVRREAGVRCTYPYLFYEVTEGGHGVGGKLAGARLYQRARDDLLDTQTDVLSSARATTHYPGERTTDVRAENADSGYGAAYRRKCARSLRKIESYRACWRHACR